MRSHHERMHISLSPRYVIFMNKNLHWLIGRPPAVNLYYNRELDQIAIEPASPKLENAFPVRERNHGLRINAASFCRHFGIRFAATHRFLNPRVTDERQIVLDLRNTSPVFRHHRRKKEKPAPARRHGPAVDALMNEFRREDEADDI